MKWIKLIITAIYFVYCKAGLCETLIAEAKNEGSLRDSITKQFNDIKNESALCIESLVLTENYKALETYTTMLNNNGIKFRESLSQSIGNIKEKLDVFTESTGEDVGVDTSYIEPKKVVPKFRWAQSMEKVFIQVKFSYRFDYPSCENVESFKTNIDESSIGIYGECYLSDIPVIFNLDLPLLKLINKANSVFKTESQGYFFDLQKKDKQYWPYLVSEEKKNDYPQMSIWYEMKSKYESELKEYEKTEEEEKSYEEIEKELKEQMRSERKKNKKNKRKKKKKTVQSDL